MELLGNLTSIQNFFTSSVDQPPLQELDVDIPAAEMGKKRSQLKEKDKETGNKPLQELDVDISAAEMGNKRSKLKEKDKETGNKPGVLDIVEPLCMEAPAEDKETTLPPEILMMVIKTLAK